MAELVGAAIGIRRVRDIALRIVRRRCFAAAGEGDRYGMAGTVVGDGLHSAQWIVNGGDPAEIVIKDGRCISERVGDAIAIDAVGKRERFSAVIALLSSFAPGAV